MTALPETPEEVEARRLRQLAEQKTMLEHLPAWLRLHHLSQKAVAEALGVSEGTISSWLSGRYQMSVAHLRQIAILVGAEPGDLLRPPSAAQLSRKVEDTLTLMDQLSDGEWQAVLETAKAIAAAKRQS